MIRTVFAWGLEHRIGAILAMIAFTCGMGAFAVDVRPDYSIEHFFPMWDESRVVYSRFKERFPNEDTQAVVIVQADDLYSPAGLARMERLEQDLEALPEVFDVEGPMSARDLRGEFGSIDLPHLFPSADLTAEEIAAGRKIATEDPLFAWGLASPDGRAVSIRLALQPDIAGTDEGRDTFVGRANKIISRHAHPGQTIVLSGLPSVRAKLAKTIREDVSTLIPAALLVILVLLLLTYRRIGAVAAPLVTILVALVWSYGTMGILGYPITMIASIIPIVVMIVSISDSIHIINDFYNARKRGRSTRDALIDAMEDSAMPCLATEVVIASGFLTLIAINIVGITQFGIATAVSMLLTWLANVTVLPLALSFTREAPAKPRSAEPGGSTTSFIRAFAGLADGIAHLVLHRQRTVLAVAGAIIAIGSVGAFRAEKFSYVFDDLRHDSEVYRELQFAEETHGGVVPIAIYIEASASVEGENPALEPAVLRVTDSAATLLRGFPEINYARSLADFLRKGHRGFIGEEESSAGREAKPGDDLPDSRQLAAQEVLFIDSDGGLRDVLSHDRRASAVMGFAKDVSSRRLEQMYGEITAWRERAQADLDASLGEGSYVVHITGQLKLMRDVNYTLVDGLMASFGGAVLVTLVLFCVVLRSLKLGLIGLIPNLSPMVLVFAFMGAVDITIRPATVVVFSIILVIADDDTIQYLARLRGHYRTAARRAGGDPNVDLHQEAALNCLRNSGQAMFVTSTAVSAGFLLLLLSQSQAVADIGLLIGVTLFAAVFADLFLSPIMVMRFRPNLGDPPAAQESESGDQERLS